MGKSYNGYYGCFASTSSEFNSLFLHQFGFIAKLAKHSVLTRTIEGSSPSESTICDCGGIVTQAPAKRLHAGANPVGRSTYGHGQEVKSAPLQGVVTGALPVARTKNLQILFAYAKLDS